MPSLIWEGDAVVRASRPWERLASRLNYSKAAGGCRSATCQWLSPGWHTESHSHGKAENVHFIGLLFCSPPGTACLGPNPQSFIIYFFLGPQLPCCPMQSDICWWNYIFSRSDMVVCHCDACFWWSWLSEKVLTLRQLTPTTWQQHEGQALTEEGVITRWKILSHATNKNILTSVGSNANESLGWKETCLSFCTKTCYYSAIFPNLANLKQRQPCPHIFNLSFLVNNFFSIIHQLIF